MYCANVVLLNLVHQVTNLEAIVRYKKCPRCLATIEGITNNYAYTYNYALAP